MFGWKEGRDEVEIEWSGYDRPRGWTVRFPMLFFDQH